MTTEYGVIGKKLGHSFSKIIFSEKFQKLGINATYEKFTLESIDEFPGLIKAHPDLRGLNVTIPYKQAAIPFLDSLDEIASEVGAVNTILLKNGKLKGFNTDVIGFGKSLKNFYKGPENGNVLIFGTGGAAKAVEYALKKYFRFANVKMVSRNSGNEKITYEELKTASLRSWNLIVNATPLGMFPDVGGCPDISFTTLGPENYLFDLIYNPEETEFLRRGKEKGCRVINGLEMLHLQAESAWEIWNK